MTTDRRFAAATPTRCVALVALAFATLSISSPAWADPLGDVGDAVGGVTDTVDDTTDAVNDTTDDVTDAVDDATGGATDDVTDTVNDAVDDTTDAVNDTTDDVTDTVNDAGDDVTGGVDDGGGIGGVAGGSDHNDSPGSPGVSGDGAPGTGTTPGTDARGPVVRDPGSIVGGVRRRFPPRAASEDERNRGSGTLRSVGSTDGTGSAVDAAFTNTDPATLVDDGGESFLQGAARIALEAAKKLIFPALLIALIVGFIVAHGRIGRKDPKLALAPVDGDHDVLTFD